MKTLGTTHFTHAYVAGLTCIDVQHPVTGRSEIAGETLEQIRLRYPGAQLVEFGPWCAAKEKALCSEPEPITEARFMEMLEVLPPQRWQRGENCESFELCEHTSGRVTAIFCRIGDRYFEFSDIAGKSLATHVAHCEQVAA